MALLRVSRRGKEMRAAVGFLVSTLLCLGAHASSLEDFMVYPSDYVEGKPASDYANIWWQWTYTMPKELSPVRDLTGEFCHAGQSGNVWFLAGGYGSSKINRRCSIPEGKYIFFPVINMVYWPARGGALTCEEAKQSAALNNDHLLSIEITLDGISAWNPANTRISSEDCFDLLGLIPRDLSPPKVYPAATDGYWVMLKPLSKGTHKLRFKAQYNRENGAFSKMAQDIEYDLLIE
jgi:hypothetical protein